MPIFPQFQQQYTQQVVTDTFGGYNHQLKIPDGEWYDTRNLTTDYAPMLANRKLRGNTNESACALLEKKALAYIGSDGILYYNWQQTNLTDLTVGEKQMVSMGAYICIFPDKKYYNTENTADHGDMEVHFTGASAEYQMVRYDGTAISASAQPTPPEDPQDAQYWVDTSGEVHILKQWSDSVGDWISVETVYIKITFPSKGEVPKDFKALDGVTISGSSVSNVNGDHVIIDLGGRAASGDDQGVADWIMITGLLDTIPSADTNLHIDLNIPNFDYVCEAQNRLWGCYYGQKDGKTVNEIYCCALGDFRNWHQFQGLSTDSWVGSVGSDGQWTGAVNYLGYPTFFKENRIHRVTISTSGAHRIDETVCRGVQKGSSKSLVVVNETLYYKSRSDVCAYQGGFPTSVSQALGTVKYHDAVAGAVDGKYYISMKDEGNTSRLFVYDIAKGIWLKEDNKPVYDFARVDNELYALVPSPTGESTVIITMLGSLPVANRTQESELNWYAVSGVQYYEYPENKRVSRYNIRMKMAQGAVVSVYVHYDGDVIDGQSKAWTKVGEITATFAGINHYVLPIRPRRCDHLQIKIAGNGDVQVYSIAKILEVGSDYR